MFGPRASPYPKAGLPAKEASDRNRCASQTCIYTFRNAGTPATPANAVFPLRNRVTQHLVVAWLFASTIVAARPLSVPIITTKKHFFWDASLYDICLQPIKMVLL